MPMQFKKGDAVEQVTYIVRGRVKTKQIVDDEPVYIVAYVDANGDKHERPFTEEQLQAATADVPPLEELQQNDEPPANDHEIVEDVAITSGDVGTLKA